MILYSLLLRHQLHFCHPTPIHKGVYDHKIMKMRRKLVPSCNAKQPTLELVETRESCCRFSVHFIAQATPPAGCRMGRDHNNNNIIIINNMASSMTGSPDQAVSSAVSAVELASMLRRSADIVDQRNFTHCCIRLCGR